MGNKTELKLLARQQSEQNWSTVPGEEMLPVELTHDYNSGVLVVVELDANRQVKTIQDATKQLIGLLKNFSRVREKFRTQEEEIEGWKQSLIYQSQELTRREVDMEARAEELEQLEAEAQTIEQKVQEFEESRQQILELKEQVEADRQQLEEAWGRLQGAQRQFEASQTTGLSDEQVHQIETLLNQLDTAVLAANPTREQFDATLAQLDQQQSQLTQYWQTLDQDRQQAQTLQDEVERQAQALDNAWQEWRQTQDSLVQARMELKLQEQALTLKSEQKDLLTVQLQAQADIAQSLDQARAGSSHQPVDVRALKEMPIEELDATVDKLQQELNKLSGFVNDQEEELDLQRQEITALEEKINNASEYDRLSMTDDLDHEKQHYRLLNETLEGQRQTLKEREAILFLHQDILYQRKRSQDNQFHQAAGVDVDLTLQQLDGEQQKLQQVLQDLEADLERIQGSIQTAQETIQTTSADQDSTQTRLKQQEQDLQQQRSTLADLWGKVNTYQTVLQPVQDLVDALKAQLPGMTTENGQSPQSATAQQQQIAAELKRVFMELGKAPEAVPTE